MKLEMKPVLTCIKTEYETEIKPLIDRLSNIDLCPQRSDNRQTTWNCDHMDDCGDCPFTKANFKIIDAIQILKDIEVIRHD